MGLYPEIILLITAIGFGSAALIVAVLGSSRQFQQAIYPRNLISFWVLAMPLMAFGGAYWLASASLRGVRRGKVSRGLAITGAVISTIWSFCAGVFVIEFLHLLQMV